MTNKFIRAFIYGIEYGETVAVTINGVDVNFTNETAQQDVEIVVAAPIADNTGVTEVTPVDDSVVIK
jgi:hypothetical protein